MTSSHARQRKPDCSELRELAPDNGTPSGEEGDGPQGEGPGPSGREPGGRTLSLQQGGEGPVRLKREFGLAHGVAIVAGLVIGGGIYVSPKGVIQYAKSPGLFLVLWGVGGVLSLLGALTYAEMGVMMPVAGEKYAYLEIMYGPLVAFLYIWKYLFLLRSGGNAIKCIMFGRYVLKPFFPDCDIPEVAVSLAGTALACVLTFVNCVSVKMSAKGQTAMTVVSLLSLSLITVSGLVWVFQGKAEGLDVALFEGTTTSLSDISLGIHSTVYAYFGWTALNFLIEELKNPERNLPLSIVISIFLTTILYVGVNFTYVAVLGVEGVMTSQAVAISLAFKTLGPAAWIMPLLIAITAGSSFNSGMMVGSRLAFAGARRGHLPQVFALVSVNFLTPVTSLLLQLVMVVVYMWTIELYTMINNLVFSMLAFDFVTVIGFIRMRLREPTPVTRKFKLPLVIPMLYLALVTLLVVVPLVTKPVESATGLALALGTGLPYYLIVVLWTDKPAALTRYAARVTHFVQRLLLCVPEEQETSVTT